MLQERWLSGRKHRTRNAAYLEGYRGFESHPLRHNPVHVTLVTDQIVLKNVMFINRQTPYFVWGCPLVFASVQPYI